MGIIDLESNGSEILLLEEQFAIGEATMPTIRCTSKLLAAIDDSPLEDSTRSTPLPLGDWYGNIFTIDRRKCIIFINESTLFVCLTIGDTKSDYRHIAPFFVDVLAQTLRNEGFTEGEVALVLSLHGELAVGRTQNRSTIASLNNRVIDTKHIIQYDGGLANCDAATVTHLLNETPMRPIGYSNGLEEMKSFLAGFERPQ